MAECILLKSGGGVSSDETTVTKENVLADSKYLGADTDDDVGVGTMPDRGNWSSSELAAGASVTVPAGKHGGSGKVTAKSLASQTGGATATDGYVYSGKTYWKDGAKRTGNMSVNSVLSFSAAAYGGKQILLKWQNPYAAKGKPFSGVEIRYATGGYPGAGGTVIYTGIGNNSAAGGWSQAVVTLPAYGTGYYFSLRPYVGTSLGTMYGSILNAYAATVAELWLTFTGSRSYVIPAGYTKMDVFAVGGGGGSSRNNGCGSGGSGGYTSTQRGIAVSQGDSLDIVVGAGRAGNGSSSTVSRLGTIVASAAGGGGWSTSSAGLNTKGGSGGGDGREREYSGYKYGGRGGSDGSKGYAYGSTSDVSNGFSSRMGQGTTTRAWGTGTLYAGGGGGGNGSSSLYAGSGGAGGGGNGSNVNGGNGANGTANTGGGAGGGGLGSTQSSGGSGIVLLHIY